MKHCLVAFSLGDITDDDDVTRFACYLNGVGGERRAQDFPGLRAEIHFVLAQRILSEHKSPCSQLVLLHDHPELAALAPNCLRARVPEQLLPSLVHFDDAVIRHSRYDARVGIPMKRFSETLLG